MLKQHLLNYYRIKDLYEEAKQIWKGVYFEILLEPIKPQPGLETERHILDFSKCRDDFGLNDGDPNQDLSIDELYTEINKLCDYKDILKLANRSIKNIRKEYKDTFNVKFVRTLDRPYIEEPRQECLSDSSESEEEMGVDQAAELEEQSEEEYFEEMGGIDDSDSGAETQHDDLSDDSTEMDSQDSGQHTDSGSEYMWDQEYESDSEMEEI